MSPSSLQVELLAAAARLFAIMLLGFAAYEDLQHRRVPNNWYIWTAIAGANALIVEWGAGIGPELLPTLALVGGACLAWFVLWAGLGLPGGDVKALMALVFVFPTPLYYGVTLVSVFLVAGAVGAGAILTADDDQEAEIPFVVAVFLGALLAMTTGLLFLAEMVMV